MNIEQDSVQLETIAGGVKYPETVTTFSWFALVQTSAGDSPTSGRC